MASKLYIENPTHHIENIMIAFQARIFLFVDLREFFYRFRVGGRKKELKMTS